jgi:UBX domain-containing protein 7
MADNDELVSQFLAFTGSADTDRAVSYLEMSNGNLETAVGLYMEHQGGGAGAGMGGGAASAAAAAGGFGGGGGDDIRAPDATRTMRLMDDIGHGGGMMGAGMAAHPYMGLDPILQQQLASSAFARDVINNAAEAADAALDASMGDGNENDSDDENEVGGEIEESKRSSPPPVAGLADMFAAPKHLMFTEGGFEGARTMAKDTKRWLLVNLQRDSEFSCHALNRDVWRDELVENLIREGFVFWQSVRFLMDVVRCCLVLLTYIHLLLIL